MGQKLLYMKNALTPPGGTGAICGACHAASRAVVMGQAPR